MGNNSDMREGRSGSGHSLCKGPGAAVDFFIGGTARGPVWVEQSEPGVEREAGRAGGGDRSRSCRA